MSDSAALEFTVDSQIFRTFRSVDLSQLVIQTVCITRWERSTDRNVLNI